MSEIRKDQAVGQTRMVVRKSDGTDAAVSDANPLQTDLTNDISRTVGQVRDYDRLTKRYANRGAVAVDGTANLITSGTATTTFAAAVSAIMVSTDLDVYVAETTAKAGAEATGAAGDRVFVPAGTVGLALPWAGQDVAIVNANATELPSVAVVGLA